MLKLYENIRELRKRNHWTQEDLAARMGYNDRSMIAKIESGKVDISQSKIMDFANVFGVDPGDLMGWDDNTYGYEVIDKDAKLFIELYQNASPDIRDAVVTLLKSAQHDT